MALLCGQALALFSASPPALPPAKISNSNALIPRFLRSSLPLSLSRTSISSNNSPQKYVYPDPIPEFAKSETQKFRVELLQKLSKEKDTFGNDLDKVVNVCSEIFSDFLHEEYGGPGTLLVEPFTHMLIVLKEKKLPGASLAARETLLWAQNHVDRDWEVWNSNLPS